MCNWISTIRPSDCVGWRLSRRPFQTEQQHLRALKIRPTALWNESNFFGTSPLGLWCLIKGNTDTYFDFEVGTHKRRGTELELGRLVFKRWWCGGGGFSGGRGILNGDWLAQSTLGWNPSSLISRGSTKCLRGVLGSRWQPLKSHRVRRAATGWIGAGAAEGGAMRVFTPNLPSWHTLTLTHTDTHKHDVLISSVPQYVPERSLWGGPCASNWDFFAPPASSYRYVIVVWSYILLPNYFAVGWPAMTPPFFFFPIFLFLLLASSLNSLCGIAPLVKVWMTSSPKKEPSSDFCFFFPLRHFSQYFHIHIYYQVLEMSMLHHWRWTVRPYYQRRNL